MTRPVDDRLFEGIRFDERGLVPAVVQDEGSGVVLMLAYMNREAIQRTVSTGRAWYYSRSRGRLWCKGETSGHYQEVRSLVLDCDRDAILLTVRQEGPACHEGLATCFHNPGAGKVAPPDILIALEDTIRQRRRDLPEGSYTADLFRSGTDRILQKVGEEAAEVIIAGKNASAAELIAEAADLVYHLLVLLASQGLSLADVGRELGRRQQIRENSD